MKQILSICRRGFLRFDQSGKRALFVYVLSLVVTAGIDGWALILVSKVLNRGLYLKTTDSLDAEINSMFLVVGLFVLRSALAVLISFLMVKKIANQEVLIGSENFARIQSGPWENKQGGNLSDLYAKVDRGPHALTQGLMFYCATVIAEMASAAVIFLAIVFLQPITAVTTAAYFSLLAVLQHKLVSVATKSAGQLTLDKGNRVYDILGDTFRLGKLLHVMHSKSLNEVLQNERNEYALARSRSLFYESFPRYLMEASLALGFVIIASSSYVFGGPSRVVPALALFAVAGFRLLPSVNRIQGLILSIISKAAVAEEALSVPPLVLETSLKNVGLGDNPNTDTEVLKLNSVRYRYPNANEDSLKETNLTFEKGFMYAIVGPSGAGKTTLVDLCLGLLKPTSGEVDRKGMSLRYGYVPQNTHMASISLEENVALEWDSLVVNSEQVVASMRKSFIADVFDGRSGENNSSHMSGGQMQRIGIARALYRNSNFLVLDEATNSLDASVEDKIIGLIENLRQKITIVVVAHRLTTVRNADKVIYIENGVIMGIGSFAELQEQIPAFANQVNLGLFSINESGVGKL